MKRRGFMAAVAAFAVAPLALVKKPFRWDKTRIDLIESWPVQVVSAREMRIPIEIRPGGKFGSFDPEGGSLGRGYGVSYIRALNHNLSKVDL